MSRKKTPRYKYSEKYALINILTFIDTNSVKEKKNTFSQAELNPSVSPERWDTGVSQVRGVSKCLTWEVRHFAKGKIKLGTSQRWPLLYSIRLGATVTFLSESRWL